MSPQKAEGTEVALTTDWVALLEWRPQHHINIKSPSLLTVWKGDAEIAIRAGHSKFLGLCSPANTEQETGQDVTKKHGA